MTRVSDYYRLGRTQPTLDFVDVGIFGDVGFFVDPRALRLLKSDWGNECVALVQDFFECVMVAIRDGKELRAKQLLSALREPNETHLGLSRARARGRALGTSSASDVYTALSRSEAATSGMLKDLEDTILLVDGIASDIISDITTNIIRQPLIHYTQAACNWYGIPLIPDVDSGPIWDPDTSNWTRDFVSLPVTSDGKLLLVPKSIVRRRMEYDADEYYRDYILEHLREIELAANSELVQLLADGRRRVTKKDLAEKYGKGKRVNLQETKKDPTLLSRYREDKLKHIRPAMDHDSIANEEGTPAPDWKQLLDDVLSITPGRLAASKYEHAIEALLSALFYPSLSNPQMQRGLHNNRKRIDITYTNIATEGFFYWLALHYDAPNIFVECKNYSEDPANPELDQLSGRFSPKRGRVGLLVCRSIGDKPLFAARCRDTATDDRGFIVYLDDADLTRIVNAKLAEQDAYKLVENRFNELVM